jgi:DNA-binding TFAR19-related protein (PDSD5 family)
MGLCRTVALVLFVAFLAAPAAQERPLPEYDSFAAQVKKHLATDEERQSGYMYLERRTEERLDGSGRATKESSKVFEVYPGLPGEDRYRRLIEEDGKPVPQAKLAETDRERRKEAESYAKKIATPAERQKETKQLQKARTRYDAAIDDLFRVYDIRMVRRELLDGHETILATLMPKPGVKPQTDDGKIMQHFKARAWISEADYELVRAEIEALDDLSFGMGLLARIHKGTTATYQRRKVNDEIWLPAQVTWTASARVMLLKRLRLRGIAEFSGYRKFTVDTSTTYTNPPS